MLRAFGTGNDALAVAMLSAKKNPALLLAVEIPCDFAGESTTAIHCGQNFNI